MSSLLPIRGRSTPLHDFGDRWIRDDKVGESTRGDRTYDDAVRADSLLAVVERNQTGQSIEPALGTRVAGQAADSEQPRFEKAT
jgi:hypothetical protein